jgi:hypothetical protein
LNKATRKDHFPLPFIDQVLDVLVGKQYFSFLDGFSGYNQIQISPEDQDKTTFTFPWGTFSYKVLPFGLCNSPTTFQREILNIFSELIHDKVEIYMDDFTPYGNSFDEALDNLDKVLQRCREMNLSLSNEKCNMMMNEGIVLGHHLSSRGIEVDKDKIKIITLLPTPLKPKDVRRFLGHARYYRRFIKDFSKIASPLFTLLSKDVDYCWTLNCQQDFETIKEKLSTAPVLQGPNWALPFHIHTDASDKVVGAVLGQNEDNKPYAIYFISKNMVGAEINYIVTEKELLAVVHALNKFRHYVTGYKVFVHTDHVSIRYLMNKPDINGRMIRWFLLLQQFDLTILDKPGKKNVVADFLSRLTSPNEEGMIDDQVSI